MPMKLIAFVLSFLSFFNVWNMSGQPNCIPETRDYVGEVPDKYGVWPTEAFAEGSGPPGVGSLLEAAFTIKAMLHGGPKTEALLVLHRGAIVYERYDEAWDADTPHYMFSITKAVVAALVGIAIQEGKIKGVDQKVIDFYPDAVIAPGQESKRDMTIEHLLTMNSGLPGDDDEFDESWPVWWEAKDSGRAAFELPQQAAPGERHAYSSGPSMQALACLVSRAVGKNLFAYAKEKLFRPLGMTSVTWDAAADGNSYGGFGISMTPRDMARFGYLLLNYGRWEDKQILPAQYVAQAPPRAKTVRAYGRLFWNFDILPFGGSYEANGTFGQCIVVLPELDTVIVRTGSMGWLFEDIARALVGMGSNAFFPNGVPLEGILEAIGMLDVLPA
jgi:CubicO group peptidase (beta-lactamase class C family)